MKIVFAALLMMSVSASANFDLQRKKSQIPASGAGSSKGPCEAKQNRCAKGQECLLIEVHCAAAPCPPIPECVVDDSKK